MLGSLSLNIRQILLLAAALPFVLLGTLAHGEDELRDSKGQIRPEYQSVIDAIPRLDNQARKSFYHRSLWAFEFENPLYPIPRIIDAKEYDRLADGAAQRARAIHAFLKDYYSGNDSFEKVIPRQVVEKIAERYGENGYFGSVRPSRIAFPFAIDLIGDKVGEDNIGYIGGLGDYRIAYDFMIDAYPKLLENFDFRDPNAFYRQMAESFKKEARRFGGKAIVFSTDRIVEAEDKRFNDILSEAGIQTISAGSDLSIKFTEDGVFTYSPRKGFKASRERVGYLFMQNAGHFYFDVSHPAAYYQYVVDRFNDLFKDKRRSERVRQRFAETLESFGPWPKSNRAAEAERRAGLLAKLYDETAGMSTTKFRASRNRSRFNGMVQAMLSGQIGTNHSPGVEFVGDKEFYVFVPDLIRHYLGEKPILSNVKTYRLTDSLGRVLTSRIDELKKNKDLYVLKVTDQVGGNGIYLGARTSKEEWLKALEKAEANPGNYVAQELQQQVEFDGMLVDRRVILFHAADGKQVVAGVPWGRSAKKKGDGKVNITNGGGEVTNLVVEKVRQCRIALDPQEKPTKKGER